MKKKIESLLPYLIQAAERIISIAAFIFPFIEIVSYFGPKVFLSTEGVNLRMFYLNHLVKVSTFTRKIIYLFSFLWFGYLLSVQGAQFH